MSVLFLEHQPNGPANPCKGLSPPAMWFALHPLEYIVARLDSKVCRIDHHLFLSIDRRIKGYEALAQLRIHLKPTHF